MSNHHDPCQRLQADTNAANWDDEARHHAASCATCAAFLATTDALTQRLRALPSSQLTMPAPLRAAMLAQLDERADSANARGESTTGPTTTAWHQSRVRSKVLVPLALAASLAVGFLMGHAGFDFGQPTPPPEVHRNIGMYIADVTHDHYLFDRISRPLEITLTAPTALSNWLSESLNFPIELPPVTKGFSLQGGRVWHTVGRLSALAVYRDDNDDRIILFAVPAYNMELTGAPSTLVNNTKVFSGESWDREARVWIDGDLAMALTAPKGKIPANWRDTFLP